MEFALKRGLSLDYLCFFLQLLSVLVGEKPSVEGVKEGGGLVSVPLEEPLAMSAMAALEESKQVARRAVVDSILRVQSICIFS